MMKEIAKTLNLSLRIFIFLLCLGLGAMFLIAGAKAALAASLRSVSVISGDTLRVGDIFDGISDEKAARILGPAPQPGQDMALNAPTLLRIALALNLPWQPSSSADQIIIRRAATLIDNRDVINALSTALAERTDVHGKFDLVLTSAPPILVVPQEMPATVEVASLRYDPAGEWFEATLAAPSKEDAKVQAAVMGKVQRLIEVPVLKSTLRSGDIIGKNDIIMIDMPVKNLQSDFLLKEENIAGLTPRRMVEAGKPIRDREVEKPQLVGRGDFVTIVYESGPLTLTAKGKALQNGAAGDMVRLVNVTSNRSIEGIVSGDLTITVSE